MTFEELKAFTKDMDLESLGVSLGKPVKRIDFMSCFQDGDQWVMLGANDSLKVFEKRGTEEEIIGIMFGYIKLRRRFLAH